MCRGSWTAAGGQIPAARSQQDFKVTLNFPEALQKGQPAQGDLYLRRQANRTGRVAGLRHQVRFDSEGSRFSDVPGALVSGQRLHGGPLHSRLADHRSSWISSSWRGASIQLRQQTAASKSYHQVHPAEFSGEHRRCAGEPCSEFFRKASRPRCISATARTWRKHTARRQAKFSRI